MSEITKDQRIAVLVYREDHPDAYPPEISTATGIDYEDVVHILREHEASHQSFTLVLDTEFNTESAARNFADILELDHHALKGQIKIKDITPCASYIRHGPGHQSKTYCEIEGPHDTHGATIMGMWEEWD